MGARLRVLAGVFLFSPSRPQNDESDSILMLHLAQEGAQKGGAGLWSMAGVTFRLLQLLDRNHECKARKGAQEELVQVGRS